MIAFIIFVIDRKLTFVSEFLPKKELIPAWWGNKSLELAVHNDNDNGICFGRLTIESLLYIELIVLLYVVSLYSTNFKTLEGSNYYNDPMKRVPLSHFTHKEIETDSSLNLYTSI